MPSIRRPIISETTCSECGRVVSIRESKRGFTYWHCRACGAQHRFRHRDDQRAAVGKVLPYERPAKGSKPASRAVAVAAETETEDDGFLL